MPKITIYVPDDLKAEMDAAEKFEPNWSALAQEAFRLECGRLKNRKRSKGKMEAAIERLRKSKERVENEEVVQGHRAGREWATNEAQYDELERVAKWHSGIQNEVIAQWNAPFGAGGWLYAEIENDGRPGSAEVDVFWEKITGVDGEPSEAFALAFAEGAAEVYDEVADKL